MVVGVSVLIKEDLIGLLFMVSFLKRSVIPSHAAAVVATTTAALKKMQCTIYYLVL